MALILQKFIGAVCVIMVAVILAVIIIKMQWWGGVGLVALPLVIGFGMWVFNHPRVGLYATLVCGFISNGLIRYVPAPLGLLIDFLLVITLLALFFQRFQSKKWPYLKQNPILVVVYIWSGFCVLQLFNPEARSAEAWFYAMRGMALYLVLVLILGMELLDAPVLMRRFIDIWLWFSCIASLFGFKQLYLGLDPAEQAWLDAGNASTHILHGQLRVFSFYSDAGQFGAAMGHAGVVALVLAMGAFTSRQRLWYGIAAACCLGGMAISGTRGALFVPLMGLGVYLVLIRNFKLLLLGGLLAATFLGGLKFTFIGQSNYQIQRMRSALDPNDPSLMVRLENQKRLSQYLASRPLGGGIGSAGYWGLRFSPNTFLAQTPTDSWYVKIWAETGIIGLGLHVAMLGFMICYFFLKIWPMPQSPHRQQLAALYAGVVGIAAASYGNQVLGQMPTGIVTYLSIALLYVHTHTSTHYPS